MTKPNYVRQELLSRAKPLPSNRFEALGGDRNGQCSICINDKGRICFTFSERDAWDVEIVDYY